jgi:signal transduction histidine kinase/ActR/RegA family two-component response regulator
MTEAEKAGASSESDAPLRVGSIDLEAQRPNFARIAKVAKALFDAPIADVEIVRGDFVWSSRQAIRYQIGEKSPAFATSAQDGVCWIEDASLDPLWADHRVVAAAPFIRFYAAAPIILQDGQRPGVLCVLDIRPKAYDENLAARLIDLANVIASECDREVERQALIRAQQRLKTAVKLGQLHVWEMDYRNQTLEKMGAEDSFYETPITYQDLSRDPFFGIHPDDVERARQAWNGRQPGGPMTPFETRVPRSDEKPVWAAMSTRPVYDEDGQLIRTIGVMQNITDRKEAENALIQARDDAEAANRAKSTFLANMSHELRTPLNGVTGLADALGRTSLTDEQREMVGIIETSARTLETLLSDLLDFSGLESGKIEIHTEPFDLMGSVRACAAAYAQLAQNKGLSFDVQVADDAQGQWLGDANRIRQVLLHLLSNAVKFTTEGGVRLGVEAHQTGLKFTVSDTGIGFDEATKARLFQRFEQADGSITRQYGGAGMGLALSQALAEAMDAQLDAQAAPGHGATFSFTLDCARLTDDSGTDELSEADESRPLRILVAEDHPTNRKVVEIMLSAFGVDLSFAENGQEAVDAYRMSRFDLVFMDMQMPVMDGLTAIRAIRDLESSEARPRTPIYTLTANAMPEHALASAQAGSDGHVTKPVTSETLLGVLVAACHGGDANDRPAKAA